jgi:hypothetical protein
MRCCRRHKFFTKALLCNNNCCYTVTGESSATHVECTDVFPLQNLYANPSQCNVVCTFSIFHCLIFSAARKMSSNREPERIIKKWKSLSWRIKVKHYIRLFLELDGGQRSSSLTSCFVLRVITRVHIGQKAGRAPDPAWTPPLLVCEVKFPGHLCCYIYSTSREILWQSSCKNKHNWLSNSKEHPEKLTDLQLVKKFSPFIEPKG